MQISDEMVEAFGNAFWSVNAASKIDGERENIRAALEAALSTDAEPVKPICNLVWKQYLRAADDVEDYYEVARPGDKCVDGSDPFPVFMRRVPEGNAQTDQSMARIVVAYDDLIRRYEGPKTTLFEGDVAEIDDAYDHMVSVANAALIAAAPELLESMKGIEHFSDALNFREDHLSKALRQWIEAGRAAIAKAEGRL